MRSRSLARTAARERASRRPRAPLELVVATNIKEYLPRHLAALFTLFKEKKEGHRISLAPGDRWLQDLPRGHHGATPPAVRLTGEDDAIVLASGGTTGTPKGVV